MSYLPAFRNTIATAAASAIRSHGRTAGGDPGFHVAAPNAEHRFATHPNRPNVPTHSRHARKKCAKAGPLRPWHACPRPGTIKDAIAGPALLMARQAYRSGWAALGGYPWAALSAPFAAILRGG